VTAKGQPLTTQIINIAMEDYYNTLLKHLDGYTVMGLFEGKRDINDIVTLQTGTRGRVFFFDQEPMIRGVDDKLWDYIFQEPTIFANSELDSADKKYVEAKYPNFVDWYFFSHGLVAREWFSAQRYNYAGWIEQKQTLLDCNLITGYRSYRLYLIYKMYRHSVNLCSYISFKGKNSWQEILKTHDPFDILKEPKKFLDRIPTDNISYDNWGEDQTLKNGLMQCRIPLDFYSRVNYIFVSETICTENKKHLTEKIFKPIAAGKPFLLAGGYKNLEYLKRYGFETFSDYWSEDYDNIINPKDRIDSIFETIRSINLYPIVDEEIQKKLDLFNQAHGVAFNNRSYFWSNEFYNLLINEAISNLNNAKAKLESKRV
jgi:hypothetical protein